MLANNFSYLIFVVLGASLIVLALFLLRKSILELFTPRDARGTLIDRAVRMRLGKMLVKRNINLRQYFFSQSTADITRHIENCGECEDTKECDKFLLDDNVHDVDNVPFCPNHNALGRVKQVQQDMKSKTRKTKQTRSPHKAVSLL